MVTGLYYGDGRAVAVGDTVTAPAGLGEVRGRDALCPPGHVVVDFGEVADVVAVADLELVLARAELWRGGGWDLWRVGALLVAVLVAWGLLLAVVHGYVWALGGLL